MNYPSWIPEKYQYLTPVLQETCDIFTAQDFEKYVDKTIQKGTKELQDLVNEARKRGHLNDIPNEYSIYPFQLHQSLYILVKLCNRLSEMGSAFFASPNNQFTVKEVRYNWKLVPESLKPLIPFAVKFYCIDDTNRGKLIDQVMETPALKHEAVAFGKLFTKSRYDEYVEWEKTHPADKCPEATVLMYAQIFLEEADIPWQQPG